MLSSEAHFPIDSKAHLTQNQVRFVYMGTLKERFLFAREKAGLSKAALARALDISKSAVSQIELGTTKNLKADTLVALERVTGVSAQWIVTGRGDPKPGPRLSAVDSDQVERIYRNIKKLPPAFRAKIEKDIDFFLSQIEPEQ
jgi:transcriptional regulator with XRE-family HTH domain